MMMTKQKNSLAERLNIGNEVRDLKLGCSFNPKNTTTAFHTIKYDFKPASVDKSKVATVDVGSNNQVTVTVPNLVSSVSVPHTIYKGNHKKYTKECLMIYDRITGDITFEKLNHNIQVKKTRSEVAKQPGGIAANAGAVQPQKLENSTMRVSTKTKVSTGSRRNNIIDFKPRNSPMQGSPSAPPSAHKSPQSAPAWNANNAQATLPSIPMIVDDDDMFGLNAAAASQNQALGSSDSANTSTSSSTSSQKNSIFDQSPQHHQQYQQQQQSTPTKQTKQSHHNNQKRHNNLSSTAASNTSASNAASKQTKQQNLTEPQSSSPHHTSQQKQQQQQQYNHYQQQQYQQQQIGNRTHPSSSILPNGNSYHNMLPQLNTSQQPHMPDMSMSPSDPDLDVHMNLRQAAEALEQGIGILSSSSSSSESGSSCSESGSDSDDSSDDEGGPGNHTSSTAMNANQQMHQLPNLGAGPMLTTTTHTQQNRHNPPPHQLQHSSGYANSNNNINNGAFTSDLLQNDLQLSSNSSDDDDD